MFLGNLNQSHALTIFSLFFGAVGVGFSFIGQSQYTMISLIFATVGFIFSRRFSTMFQRDEAQIAFGLELELLSKAVVYGMLPASLLISLSLGSTFSVLIGALYILAVCIRLAHFNQAIEYQGGQAREGMARGIKLELSALIIPLISLLAYVIPLSVFQYILAIVFVILAIGFVVDYPLPKIPEKWLPYVLILSLVLVVAYLFLGSLTAV